MTTYKYKARNAGGAPVSGVVEAYDEYEAMELVRRSCPIVEDLTPVKQKRRINMDLNEPLWVEDKSLALVAGQFSILLRAGLPMSRVVELIADQTTDKLMKKILTACAADVASGHFLSRSLEKNGRKIPTVFIESVRSGEESGTLEESFDSLKTYYERAHKVKSKVRGALTYPIVLLLLSAVVIGIVMVMLVPRLTNLLAATGGEMPGAAKALIAASSFFQNYWALMLIVLAAAGFGAVAWNRTEEGKIKISSIRMRLPVLGRVAKMNTAAQLANTMSTLLGSGLPVTRVTGIVSRVLDMRCVGVELEKGVAKLETGRTLAEVLSDVKNLPEMLVEMTRVGEESGSLEMTLKTIGEFYDAETQRVSELAIKMLEPAITIIMGVVIGFIVIAMYSAVFAMTMNTGM